MRDPLQSHPSIVRHVLAEASHAAASFTPQNDWGECPSAEVASWQSWERRDGLTSEWLFAPSVLLRSRHPRLYRAVMNLYWTTLRAATPPPCGTCEGCSHDRARLA